MTKFVLEAPAGAIAITAGCKDGKCETVEFVNTPSFVGKLDVEVEVGGKPKPLPATHLLGDTDGLLRPPLRMGVEATQQCPLGWSTSRSLLLSLFADVRALADDVIASERCPQ